MKTMLHMIVTLVIVGLLSGGALSVVNQATAPRIAEQEPAPLRAGLRGWLTDRGPDRWASTYR